MNTHDIELPPLPKASKMYDIPGYDDEELKDYARAAINLYQKRIEELEAQLEAIGAGGVSSHRITSQRRGEPVAWESTTPTYRKYVTDSTYQRFSDKSKRWYKPYRCASCDGAQTAAPAQEPDYFTYVINEHHRGISETIPPDDSYDAGTLVPLYSVPQPAEPDEWKLAVDHELTNIHSTADSYSSAKDAVKALIDWHVAVATDPVFQQPAVPSSKDSDDFFTNDNPKLRGLNEPVKTPSDDDSLTIAYMSGYHDGKRSATPEGWQLVPKEPTKEMLAATSWPNCAGTDYKHMLAAAPKFGEDLWTG